MRQRRASAFNFDRSIIVKIERFLSLFSGIARTPDGALTPAARESPCILITMPTMKDVAKAAGVSVASVSHAFTNNRNISAQTQRHVLKVAAEIGYTMNPLVSALMKSRRTRCREDARPVLAFLSAYDREDGWENSPFPVLGKMHAGAKQRALDLGFQPMGFWLRAPGLSSRRLSEILYHRGIQGVLIAPVESPWSLDDFDWNKFSTVSIGMAAPTHPALYHISHDHHAAMLSVFAECRKRGYRRPGVVLESVLSRRIEWRWEAAANLAVNAGGLAQIPPLLLERIDHPESLRRWLAKYRPDVIVTHLYNSVPKHLKALRIEVPKDVGLVSLSATPEGKISGICQNGEEIGATAVDQLVGLVQRNKFGPTPSRRVLLILGQWFEGETLPVRTETLQNR